MVLIVGAADTDWNFVLLTHAEQGSGEGAVPDHLPVWPRPAPWLGACAQIEEVASRRDVLRRDAVELVLGVRATAARRECDRYALELDAGRS
jgi:hypothetical protein